MDECDYSAPWYHGSQQELTVLRKGSWVTQFKELAKAFSHRPLLISMGESCRSVKHDGQQVGYLYEISEPIGPNDARYHENTAQTHWQTQRDLGIRLIGQLPLDDPPQLTAEEIAKLRKEIPEGTTGFIGEPDA